MLQFLITLTFAFLVFLLFALASMLGVFMGRKANHRCACSTAKHVMKQYEQRLQEQKNRSQYDPRTVEPGNLPIVNNKI